MSQALLNMWISFFALALMFVSAGAAIFSREKLKGWIQKIVLAFSFVCLLVSGVIVFLIVIGGPTATM
ncbi:DUF2768 domain-containing protein [Halalkalibacter nanhaiisediminis]|uniref:Uncharacterized protein DUF2768 n=1 Tax=Halalkalibacter nanhaiisediminis TaxID=688079 RepID=A0A562QQ69_9BACI|nr:DUF2768 domain-containing protein [Halalkalibacter nanhaiisediminis]TWI58845.1 uncharacterized protein DUF2768 [Halalkalibacter nanhaiisediminis]